MSVAYPWPPLGEAPAPPPLPTSTPEPLSFLDPQPEQPVFIREHGLATEIEPPIIPAWFASVLLHVAVLLLLSMIFLRLPERPVQIVAELAPETVELDKMPDFQQFRFTDEMKDESGSPQVMGVEIPASIAPETKPITEIAMLERPSTVADIQMPSMRELSSAPQQDINVLVKGDAGIGTVGATGAVDRITEQILLSLEQRKTLVVWMFDKSLSMQAQRDEVNSRFERVYKELGVSHLVGPKRAEKPLLTAVMSFGQEVNFLTKQPTDDLAEIQRAVAGIENDPSGVEMTFTGVGLAAQKYESYRTDGNRNVMIVIFTDEVGDDEDQIDRVINQCRRNAMPVYVVGVPAPFGRSEIEVRYVDPDPQFSQADMWLPVRQGPESLMPEVVKIAFSGRRDLLDDVYRMDSGFGPYSLTRLCYETGGLYFAVHGARPPKGGFVPQRQTPVMSARLAYFFDPDVMRTYQPDYAPAVVYNRMLSANKTKWALVEAAKMSQVMPMEAPATRFAKLNEEDEARYRRSLDEAQKASAFLEPRVGALYAILKQGEADRPKVVEPRWQAGYDLAMGRTLAVKVRTEIYNAMIAGLKNGRRFENPRNNTWTLEPAEEVTVGSILDKQSKQAREYLSRVVKDHPGTPWAMLAAMELEEPMSWKWAESFTEPPAPRPQTPPNPNNVNRPPQNRTPMPRMLPRPPAPVRPNIKL